MQNIFKGCILHNTPEHKISEICEIQVEGKSLRIPLPGLWSRPSSTSFYEIIKNPNFNFTPNKYSSDNLFRRPPFNGEKSSGDKNSQRLDYFSLPSHLGFVINLKKSVLTPQTRIEFLGIMIDSNAMTLSLPEGKAQSLTKLCQHTLTSQQITLKELASLIGKLRATAPAILPAPLQLRYLQQLLIQKQQLYQCYESLVN